MRKRVDLGTGGPIAFGHQNISVEPQQVDRKRGTGMFNRVDTINIQREGTSFALSDTDYGDKTCVISQGLGTTSVSHKGKTYWVCCSGCKAAFEEEPDRWIAKFEELQKMKK